MGFVLAIDQGTTSSRAMLFAARAGRLEVAGRAQAEFSQSYPKPGWVEHDPEEILATVLSTAREAFAKAPEPVAALGITNQRETVVVWERATGRAIHPAIVWQDRRTAEACAALRASGHEALVSTRTGLLLDPYFSATKIAWILDRVDGARAAAAHGDLAFGTIDSFLVFRLTGGVVHATDATNASRTSLYDIGRGQWDDELLALFRVPRALLPEVRDSSGDYGVTAEGVFPARVPIRGVAGDQQAAAVGQACFAPGAVKSTYGTGCFALLNTGDTFVRSGNRLLSTVALQLGGTRTYALEGSIFVAGAAVQWLRDGLRVLDRAEDSGTLADSADPAQDVVLVPAFVGLGAPYWDAECRGAIFGLTRGTGRAELARAALESVCFQTCDLLDAMAADWGGAARTLRVDGGMAASDWTMQRLADLTGAPVDRPAVTETTALGAAYLAALASGLAPEPASFAREWALERRFEPAFDPTERARRLALWRDAVSRTLTRRG